MYALQFYRNFVAIFFKRSAILHGKRPFCIFESLFGGLGATYDVHLQLIKKPIMDFVLVLIKLVSLGVTAMRRATSE